MQEWQDASRPRVAITFDDGFSNFYKYAVPLLRKYEIPATVFIVSGTLDNTKTNLETDRTMNRAQLKELVDDDLITIGNHTRTHPELPTLSSERQVREEIVGAKENLESILGTDIDLFAYPYGEFDERAVAAVRDTHRAAVATIPEPWKPSDNIHQLPRISAHNARIQLHWALKDLELR
ncbi:polysaccharide deacetylase family protein [Halosimplex aquaticum]